MSKTKLFNLLTLGAITLGLVGGCGQEHKQVTSEPQPPQQEQEVEQEVIEIPITVEEEVEEEPEVKQEVKMNEPIIIKSFGEDAVKVTITEVRFTDDRNEHYDGVPVENVVFIKAEIENISDEEQTIWGDEIFTLYDANGNKLDTYPSTDYEFEDYASINPTRKATIEECFGIPTGTDFELEVVADTWDGGVIGSLFFKGTVPQEQQKEEVKEVKKVEQKEEVKEVKQQGDYILEHDGYSFEGKEYKGIGERGLHKDVDKQLASEIISVFGDCEYELYKIEQPSTIYKAWTLLLYDGTRKDFVKDMVNDVETHFSGMLGIAFVSSLLQDVNVSVIGTDGYEIYSYQNGEEGVSIDKWATEKQMNDITKAIENSEELQQQFKDLE